MGTVRSFQPLETMTSYPITLFDAQVHARQTAERLAADPAAQVAPLANCHKSLPRFLAGRPVFTLASRANASTRAVRNEEELLAHVRERYDVVVQVSGSHTPLLKASDNPDHANMYIYIDVRFAFRGVPSTRRWNT